MDLAKKRAAMYEDTEQRPWRAQICPNSFLALFGTREIEGWTTEGEARGVDVSVCHRLAYQPIVIFYDFIK